MPEITLNQLAENIERRFDAIDLRFEAMAKRFDAMDQRFGAMDAQIEKLATAAQSEFMTIHKEMTAMDNRLSYAIGQVDAHLSAYATQWNRESENLRRWTGELEGRLTLLERKQVS